MKLVRYLETANLLKSDNIKQPNGTYKKDFKKIDSYEVQKNILNDQVSATIYGANINKMYNISTALGDLESFLIPKVDNKKDNISLYFIELENSKYKIKSVTSSGIVIERLWEILGH